MSSVSHDFNFPFQPYEIQQSFMTNLYKVVENEKIGIFESPTGTGKSLSLLCATLKFIKDLEEKVQNELQESIESLNREILSCIDRSDDWISEQYELMQKKQQLLEHQTKLDKIKAHNQKIRDIRNKIHEKERKLIVKQKALESKNNDDDLLDVDHEETDEQDDFLIAEVESDSDEETVEETDEFQPVQVFFCSRTHSQLSQLVGEVKSTIYSKDLRSVSLASRQNYCINKSVKDLRNNNLINERCLELQKSKSKITKKDEDKNPTKSRKIAAKSCPFYKKNLESLKNLSLTKVMDIEELVKAGVEEKSCPYYSSRAAVNDSQIIFMPYQILFSKPTRDQCGIKLKDSIVIVDEAHNLMDTISQIHTATITLQHLKLCHTHLINYKMKYVKRFAAKNLLKFNQLIFIAKQLLKFLESNSMAFKAFELHELLSDASIYNINLIDILKFCDQTRFAQKVHGYSKIHDKLQAEQEVAEELKKNATKNLLLELQEKAKKKTGKKVEEKPENQENIVEVSTENQTNVIRILVQFLECLSQRYEGGRILVTHNAETKETTMKFLLLDPSNPFEDIIRDCRSIILAGGTMKPTEELTEQLFKNCKERVEIHSFGHVVPSKSILPIALSHGCSGKEFVFTHVNKNCGIMVSLI
jgi:chromosome transmission fidelity protein 1